MSQGGRLVGHPTHEAFRTRAAAGFLLQPCVWVALHPIISRAWIVVLWGEGGTERSSVLLLMWSVSEKEKPVAGEQDVQGPCVSTTPQHTTWLVSTQLHHCSILQFQVQTLPQAPRPVQLVSYCSLPTSHTPAKLGSLLVAKYIPSRQPPSLCLLVPLPPPKMPYLPSLPCKILILGHLGGSVG